jgi:hypothetical protein
MTSYAPSEQELRDTWPRFMAHWMAASLGVLLQIFLPSLLASLDPNAQVQLPRWWAALAFSVGVSLVGAIINANAPIMPREVLKSIALGFGLNTATAMAGVNPA